LNIPPSIPDWKLPEGVDRGLWDYIHSQEMISRYDQSLAGTPLLEVDLTFCREVFSPPGKLVDLGCGTGRLAIDFAKRGFEVTAVDLSAGMLAEVARKAAIENVMVSTIEANLTDLAELPSSHFDYAACLFSTLGMLRTALTRGKAVSEMHRILKPGNGKLVLHVHNRHFQLQEHGGFRPWLHDQIRGLVGKPIGDRTMSQAYAGAELTLHHFSLSEIKHNLKNAGFTIDRILSLSIDGVLRSAGWFPRMRAYGFLILCHPG
jgi:ubiquinone/menaquinone biosynthesis C-methylase UbiE